MSGKFFNKPANELRILVAPLDWGIGHATRCIPIVYALINAGATVILAGEGNIEIILKKEFPDLPFLRLKGYNIRYSRQKRWFIPKLLSQVPAIIRTIHTEQKWLRKVVQEHQIDGIISDNRFGLSHPDIPAVYITHQLHIETGNSWLNRIAQNIHYGYINRFTACWVPDVEGAENLGGLLSHPQKLPAVPVRYLGVLSRFTKNVADANCPLLIVLSGPEPQRSIFEATIVEQLKSFDKPATLVRGLPGTTSKLAVSPNVTVVNYAAADTLNELTQNSRVVLARSGYSTVMDLAVLQQQAILVPTPGQQEQEYLAISLMEKGLFYSCRQQHFNLQHALAAATNFYKSRPTPVERFHEDFIKDWLGNVRQ